jgi:hypothetical protein
MGHSMPSPFFLGAYWGRRKEPQSGCVRRLAKCLQSLGELAPNCDKWFPPESSRRESAGFQFEFGEDQQLLKYLVRDQQFADIGYKCAVWNGTEDPAAVGLSCHCGSYSRWVNNNFLINWSSGLKAFLKHDRMTPILAAMALAWEPSWAGVMNSDTRDLLNAKPGRPFIDWMIYLSDDLLPVVPTLKPPARCERVDDMGTLIVVQPEPTDPTNREHLRNIERAQTALEKVWTVADDA